MNYKNAYKCGQCPKTADENGCPLWWEFPSPGGAITKGCGLSQGILFRMLTDILHATMVGTHQAAASADKSANAAAEAANASMAGMSLILGLTSGQIRPPQLQLEAKNGDETVQPRLGAS